MTSIECICARVITHPVRRRRNRRQLARMNGGYPSCLSGGVDVGKLLPFQDRAPRFGRSKKPLENIYIGPRGTRREARKRRNLRADRKRNNPVLLTTWLTPTAPTDSTGRSFPSVTYHYKNRLAVERHGALGVGGGDTRPGLSPPPAPPRLAGHATDTADTTLSAEA